MFSYAAPLNTGWVATALTLSAPFSLSMFAALQRVPAVSTISSTITTFLPSTSPIAVIEPTTLALSLDLWQTISGQPRILEYAFALFAPPISGAAIERFSMLRPLK